MASKVCEYPAPAVTAGRAEDVMIRGFGMTTTAEFDATDWVGLPLSVTLAVKVAVPLEVGVPAIVPVEGTRLSPAGKLPDAMDHLYGVVPPLACNACEYAAPTLTAGSTGGLMAKVVGLTKIAVVADADCAGALLSVTVAMKAAVPLAAGVPEMAPVDDVRANPAGNFPEVIDHT